MTAPFLNLSPSEARRGRTSAWIERGDGRVLMVALNRGGWTLPGGGIHPGETPQQAAVREAWEEAGAHGEVAGEPFRMYGAWDEAQECVPLRLLALEPSPEGRPVAWVNPRSLPWADDVQLRQVLAARGETPPALARPPLVVGATKGAAAHGFAHSCSFETGRLLRTLAASRPGGRVLELGGGMGVGTAWLLAGLDAAARLLTVDADPVCAGAVASLLAGDPRAEARCADWREALKGGPFDLIFVDCAPAKGEEGLDALVDALRPGGLLVLDDFSPPAFLPERLHGGDSLRDALFTHPRLLCTEVGASRRENALLATRTV
ncbi:NUDIX domain-containing protein [Deinococcus sp. MIMF12]|uniref:NUDIX domain-containing protein n=1 Tax=Deinococcus rhizophilus TaxID=3049544 RepID=A0ABT7JCE2_9DEIO|nr:NUDIX domain-containing protein [Deinococcus rhizophilus]MDL2342719.1 NUDIX domain-containing protein [Deinococcus rhizophilus]